MLIKHISVTKETFNVLIALQEYICYNYTPGFSSFIDTSGYVVEVDGDASLTTGCRELDRILSNFDDPEVKDEISFYEEEYAGAKLSLEQLKEAYVFFQYLMDYDMVIFDLNTQ